jgi:hypothetical protein
VKATKVITFNAISELSLDSATLLVASSGAELEPAGTKFELDTERASLIFAEEIPAGSKATLRVGFRSALTDSMSGYYKSTWEKGIYALTQFEVRVAVRVYLGLGIFVGPTTDVVSESPEDSTCSGGAWCSRTSVWHSVTFVLEPVF